MTRLDDVSFRPLSSEEGPALAALAAASPDAGRVSFAVHYRIDAYEALQALHPSAQGFVAEPTDGAGGLIGAGLVRFGECQYEWQTRPYALLHHLMVHPDHRRRGVASGLAERRVELAQRTVGDDGLILSNIQEGNVGSQRTARRWRHQLTGELWVIPMRPLAREPRRRAGITVREAEPAEYETIAERLNGFYDGHNLFQIQTGEALAAWCRETPFETPFRRYWVAVDDQGQLRAGLATSEEFRLRSSRIVTMPTSLRLLNSFMRVVPRDGALREVVVDKIWHEPDDPDAARHLLEVVRWHRPEGSNALRTVIDPRTSLRDVVALQPWSPKGELNIAVRGPVPMSTERPICPIV